jgi:hypothetical protein
MNTTSASLFAFLLAGWIWLAPQPAWAEEKPVFSEGGASEMPATSAADEEKKQATPQAKPSAGPVYRDEKVTTSVDASCDNEKDADKRNLCRATHPLDKENKNRYQNKDHSDYYCSLIKNRDSQSFCYAVVNKNKLQCGLIVNPNLEKECYAKVQ